METVHPISLWMLWFWESDCVGTIPRVLAWESDYCFQEWQERTVREARLPSLGKCSLLFFTHFQRGCSGICILYKDPTLKSIKQMDNLFWLKISSCELMKSVWIAWPCFVTDSPVVKWILTMVNALLYNLRFDIAVVVDTSNFKRAIGNPFIDAIASE